LKSSYLQIGSNVTIEQAKQRFVHGLVRLCQPRTKRKIKKGYKTVKPTKKRNPNGKFAR
jgi:hypothetical protein